MKLRKLTQKGLAPVLIVVIVVVVLAVAGVGYYVWQKQQSNNNSSTSQGSSSQVSLKASNGGPDFNPIVTDSQSFEATISGTQNGKAYTATIRADGKGVTEYVSETDGTQYRLVTTSDSYYSCTGTTCYVNSITDSTSTTDAKTYEYTQSDIDNFRTSATYVGQRGCTSGTCDVWQYTDQTTGDTTLIYVDSNRQIVQLDVTTNGETSTITFNYKDVSIDIPTNATKLQTP